MKKFLRRLFIILLVILVIIQFIRPKKNISPEKGPNDISTKYPIPDSLRQILSVACYDCHSNNTRYPWYSKIQPVYWWLNSHIQDGKNALNFSEFTSYRIRKQFISFKDISKLVKDDEMPLASYLWIHTDARFSDVQKNMLTTWAMAQHDSIQAKYPADSLAKNKFSESEPD